MPAALLPTLEAFLVVAFSVLDEQESRWQDLLVHRVASAQWFEIRRQWGVLFVTGGAVVKVLAPAFVPDANDGCMPQPSQVTPVWWFAGMNSHTAENANSTSSTLSSPQTVNGSPLLNPQTITSPRYLVQLQGESTLKLLHQFVARAPFVFCNKSKRSWRIATPMLLFVLFSTIVSRFSSIHNGMGFPKQKLRLRLFFSVQFLPLL